MEVTLPLLTTAWDYENLALLGHNAANINNSLPKFRDNLSVPTLHPENGTDSLSRNVGKYYYYSLRNDPEEARFTATSRWKPEITGLKLCQQKKGVHVGANKSNLRFDTPYEKGETKNSRNCWTEIFKIFVQGWNFGHLRSTASCDWKQPFQRFYECWKRLQFKRKWCQGPLATLLEPLQLERNFSHFAKDKLVCCVTTPVITRPRSLLLLYSSHLWSWV